MVPTIAFDESGNTGQHLLDEVQPVFVLASVHLSPEDAEQLLGGVRSRAAEPKFTTLRKRHTGQLDVVALLGSTLLTKERVKVFFCHKRFLVTTKVVDMLVEAFLHARGIDLYKRGANIALANAWHMVMPTFIGPERWHQVQLRFVEMVRGTRPETVEGFYDAVWQARRHCNYEPFKRDLEMLLRTREVLDAALSPGDLAAIDPAVPTFIQLLHEWGDQLGGRFDVVHDDSKLLEDQRRMLEVFMDPDEPEVVVGYDRRKGVFPLKANGIAFRSSQEVPQLQVADLIAGAVGYWAGGLAGRARDRFWNALSEADLGRFVTGTIWPSAAVTPEELGTEEEGGINAVEYTAELIRRQRRKR